MSKRDVLKLEGCTQAWTRALAGAGVTLGNLSFVETHDCFTIAELMEYEAMGLVLEGQGARAVAEGLTEKNGRLPVNPSGGLKPKRRSKQCWARGRCPRAPSARVWPRGKRGSIPGWVPADSAFPCARMSFDR